MILADHNAKLLTITPPPDVADPSLGQVATNPIPRWVGNCQAHLREDTIDELHGGQRVRVPEVAVTLPQNLPVYPQTGDIVTFQLLSNNSKVTFRVREVNQSFELNGKLIIRLRSY